MEMREMREIKIYYLQLNRIGSMEPSDSEIVAWSYNKRAIIDWIKGQECEKWIEEGEERPIPRYFKKDTSLYHYNKPMLDSQGLMAMWMNTDKIDDFVQKYRMKEITTLDIMSRPHKGMSAISHSISECDKKDMGELYESSSTELSRNIAGRAEALAEQEDYMPGTGIKHLNRLNLLVTIYNDRFYVSKGRIIMVTGKIKENEDIKEALVSIREYILDDGNVYCDRSKKKIGKLVGVTPKSNHDMMFQIKTKEDVAELISPRLVIGDGEQGEPKFYVSRIQQDA